MRMHECAKICALQSMWYIDNILLKPYVVGRGVGILRFYGRKKYEQPNKTLLSNLMTTNCHVDVGYRTQALVRG